MSGLLPAAIALPLLCAGLTIVVGRRLAAQRVIAFVGVGFVLVAAALLLVEADSGTPVVTQLGGWDAPAGITMIADRFSAIVLTVSATMLVAVLWYAVAQLGRDALDWSFHAKYLVLTAGISLSLLTGDLFNLFVGFEVMLIASYALLTAKSGPREIRATMTYVVINLLASALFLVVIAFVYGATGTMNMADLSVKLADIDPSVRNGLGLLMLVVFGIKAALFPLFMWLPDSYPTAPAPVAAIFAGLLTKVGVFVIIRTQTLLFPQEGPSTLILFVAGATMAVGVLGAIAQNDIKRILSFHIVSQIGYMIMGLGFLTEVGLAAAILYITHHIIVKTGLFLVGGLVETEYGSGGLERVGGLLHRRPVVAVLFIPLALSLAGIPPFSGFVAKLALVQEGIAQGRGVIVTVSLAVGLLTLFSMTKIWAATFWGAPKDTTGGSRTGMVSATALVVALSLMVAVFAQPLANLSTRAAGDLIDPTGYIEAVLGGT
ncbi:MAG: proton-conducting transporter membrane subunit [Acidimicrobiia bacterium]